MLYGLLIVNYKRYELELSGFAMLHGMCGAALTASCKRSVSESLSSKWATLQSTMEKAEIKKIANNDIFHY
jgi:hypothetical protein